MELRRKKSIDKAYSIFIQKSKGSSAFDEQKVKNIAIEYWFFAILLTKSHQQVKQSELNI